MTARWKLALKIVFGLMGAGAPCLNLEAASLSLDQDFRAPLFTQPLPAARTLLLPDGKYLLFFGPNTLTDQRTGAITRYFPDGTLDPSFNFSRDYDDVSAVAVTPTGQFIIAATQYTYGSPQTEIIRLQSDGSIDATFANAQVGAGVASANVRAIALQPDGRILVAGFFDTFAGLDRQKIVRLLPDGDLDSNFTPPQFAGGSGIWTRPVSLPDGKILIAGDFTQVNGVPSLSVARLNVDGSHDSSFQAAGFNRVNGYPIRGLVMQGSGRIVFATRVQFGSGATVTRAPLFRLNSDGSADTTFTSATNFSSPPVSRDLTAQADGKLIAAINFSLYRFHSNGALDSSFSSPTLVDGGWEAFALGGASFAINVKPDGRILFGGQFTDVNTSGQGTDAHFGVARLNADGTLDPTFLTSHKTGLEVLPSSFARLSDGSTLATFGIPDLRIEPPVPFHLARLLGDGSLDQNFGLSSSEPHSIVALAFLAVNFDRLADDKFLVAGTTFQDGYNNPAVGKFRPTGEEDPSFVISPSAPSFEKATPLPDGRALLAAGKNADHTLTGVLTRLTVDGMVDPSLHLADSISSAQVVRSNNGDLKQLELGSYVLAVQTDGKILFLYLSSADQLFHLVRLDPDGSIDPSFTVPALAPGDSLQSFPYVFDPVKQVVLIPPNGVWSAVPPVRSAVIQADGRIVLAGEFTSFGSIAARGLVRLQPDGTVDTTFATGNGAQWVQTVETPSSFPFVEVVASQADGKLLIAGTFEAFNGVVLPGIASLNSDGSVDSSLAPPAKRNRYSEAPTRLARQADGSFLLSGPYSFPNESDPAFIHINSAGGVPVVGGATLATVVAGQGFHYQIIASGQPTSYSVLGLPPGLNLDTATGKVTGISNSLGTYVVSVAATNADGTSASYQITLVVTGPPPVITSETSATGYLGQTFTYQITASNQPTSFRAEGLPDHLAIDEDTGVISGIPTYTGSWNIIVRALNSGGSDRAVLALTVQEPPAPANDNFADAQVISGAEGSVDGSNLRATAEVGEPSHDGIPGGASIWYRWTAPRTGNFAFDTNGSSVNTVLAIYSGSSVNNLALVSAYRPYLFDTNRVPLTATAGAIYRIALDAYVGSTGATRLTWRQAEPPAYSFATLAGNPPGDFDGTAGSTRFSFPWYVAADANGNVYVSDRSNHTLRKITPAGGAITVAGLAGNPDSTDGSGGAARFNNPGGMAIDSSGSIYLADTYNHVIRKITSAGVVSTYAGNASYQGSNDGTRSTARFTYPQSVASDSAGTLYVADTGNNTIRKISPAQVVTTLAGSPQNAGTSDGTGSNARFNRPTGLRADALGNIYVADSGNHTIRKITPAGGSRWRG